MKVKKEEIKQWINDVYTKLWALFSMYGETDGFKIVPEGEEEEGPQDFVNKKLGEINKIKHNFCMYMDEEELAELKKMEPRLVRIDQEAAIAKVDTEVSEALGKLDKIIHDTAYFFGRHFNQHAISCNVTFWWGAINPHLVYYDRIFGLMEKYPETYMEMIPFGTELPGAALVAERNAYFERNNERNKRENLNWSKEGFFQEELLNTLKRLFEDAFQEYL